MGYLASRLKKRLANKVTAAIGINVGNYSLRKKFSLIKSIISFIAALLPFIISKLKKNVVKEENPGGTLSPAQPLKSRATLIPTDPPPLTKEERHRKYMPPAMRAELEAKDKPFSDVNPICPHCKKPMILRVAHNGPTPGSKFWGCPNYPSCRHTIVAT